ncbi:MAG TPA: hypothetical protein PLX89_15960 [Verrucomicrobiota bacterium]|nr:hypothetical protein [Verrucomicrobiales bacterium]HRI14491.1 hypothetical protein [Verrucomicrobiota bacterium]
MKSLATFSILLSLFCVDAYAQPITNIGPLVSLDFDDSGTTDVRYSSTADKIGDLPEDWIVGFGIEPWRASRFVRATNTRLQFRAGETISSSRRALTNYLPDPPLPPSESYGFRLLAYRAIRQEDWRYSTFGEPAYESESELLIGLRLSLTTGTHYGWLRLSRPVVDSHTAFDLVDYAVHPVPNEPILAGQPPPLPPIQTQIDSESLTFSWDARWGALVLESTTNLVPPITWETVIEGNGDPVAVPTEDEQRFYRLRQP